MSLSCIVGTYAMDEDRGIQAVVDIYVQSGQLSKAEADLAVASSLTVVGAREQLNAAVREKMNADSIGGIQAAADSFVQSGKLSKGQADLAVASSLTVAGAQRKLNAAVNKQKQLKKKAEKEKKEKAKMEEKEKAKMGVSVVTRAHRCAKTMTRTKHGVHLPEKVYLSDDSSVDPGEIMQGLLALHGDELAALQAKEKKLHAALEEEPAAKTPRITQDDMLKRCEEQLEAASRYSQAVGAEEESTGDEDAEDAQPFDLPELQGRLEASIKEHAARLADAAELNIIDNCTLNETAYTYDSEAVQLSQVQGCNYTIDTLQRRFKESTRDLRRRIEEATTQLKLRIDGNMRFVSTILQSDSFVSNFHAQMKDLQMKVREQKHKIAVEDLRISSLVLASLELAQQKRATLVAGLESFVADQQLYHSKVKCIESRLLALQPSAAIRPDLFALCGDDSEEAQRRAAVVCSQLVATEDSTTEDDGSTRLETAAQVSALLPKTGMKVSVRPETQVSTTACEDTSAAQQEDKTNKRKRGSSGERAASRDDNDEPTRNAPRHFLGWKLPNVQGSWW